MSTSYPVHCQLLEYQENPRQGDFLFRTLFAAGFNGPLALERVDGKGGPVTAATVDERIAAAHNFLAPLLEKTARG